jgi:ribosome assembly protein 4
MIHELKGHGHWINSLCLHTDYVLRTSCYSEKPVDTDKPEELQKIALERYKKAKGDKGERLVSASDDHTLYLWDPIRSTKPVNRMTGHQQPIIMVFYLNLIS